MSDVQNPTETSIQTEQEVNAASPYMELANKLDDMTPQKDGKGGMITMQYGSDYQPTVMALPLLNGFDKNGTGGWGDVVAFDAIHEDAPNYLIFTPDGIVAARSPYLPIDDGFNGLKDLLNTEEGTDEFLGWVRDSSGGDKIKATYDNVGLPPGTTADDTVVELRKIGADNIRSDIAIQKAVQSLVALNNEGKAIDVKGAIENSGGLNEFRDKCLDMKNKVNNAIIDTLKTTS